MKRSAVFVRSSSTEVVGATRKKTAARIHQEIAREVNQLLSRIFAERGNHGLTDLEAVENALRVVLAQAGAAALSELLQFDVPAPDQRQLPCPCGHHAQYRELRSKPVLTVVGQAQVSRPYYLCPHCHQGQFPADVELDIKDTEFSPGVRRMHALVGQDAPFDHGREQMKVLAGLEVTAKSVERIAEAIGEDIAQREREEMQKAIQLDLPVVGGQSIPVLYVELDGTGVPVVKKETVGRQAKTDGQPPIPGKSNWGVCSPRPSATRRASPSATRIRRPTPERSRPPKSLANVST